jgi:hypothetical protein
MSLPSVPIVLNKEYRLLFNQTDIIAIEERLGCGSNHLFRKEMIGLRAGRLLLWRGLREESKEGNLSYVFGQTPEGLDDAGQFIVEYIRSSGSTYPDLFDKIAPAFADALGINILGPEVVLKNQSLRPGRLSRLSSWLSQSVSCRISSGK